MNRNRNRNQKLSTLSFHVIAHFVDLEIATDKDGRQIHQIDKVSD